jgi:hypothetical protein
LPLPCVAVIGDSKSGKSSLINALLGAAALPTGFRHDIRVPVLITHSPKPSLVLEFVDRRRVATDWVAITRIPIDNIRRVRLGVPIGLLNTYRLVETPGFATGCDDLDRRTREACRRSNAAIWCTPAVQAWKASERDAWLSLPRRLRKRSILAVTYKDAIPSERDAERLRARLRADAGPYFSSIVMIASTEVIRGQQPDNHSPEDVSWGTSGGAEFCAAMRTLLASPRL